MWRVRAVLAASEGMLKVQSPACAGLCTLDWVLNATSGAAKTEVIKEILGLTSLRDNCFSKSSQHSGQLSLLVSCYASKAASILSESGATSSNLSGLSRC